MPIRRTLLASTVALVAVACTRVPAGPTEFVRDATGRLACPPNVAGGWSTDRPLPQVEAAGYRGRIVPPAAAVAFLCQCSRNTGGPPDAYWSPRPEDIEEMEDKLPLFVRDHPPTRWPYAWTQWRELALYRRLYLGVVRDGSRRVSVDLARAPIDLKDWPAETGVGTTCDGGPRYFGVEYDVDRHEFAAIDYNGLP
jgi:hypothetical protein